MHQKPPPGPGGARRMVMMQEIRQIVEPHFQNVKTDLHSKLPEKAIQKEDRHVRIGREKTADLIQQTVVQRTEKLGQHQNEVRDGSQLTRIKIAMKERRVVNGKIHQRPEKGKKARGIKGAAIGLMPTAALKKSQAMISRNAKQDFLMKIFSTESLRLKGVKTKKGMR